MEQQVNSIQLTNNVQQSTESLREHVLSAIEGYFQSVDTNKPSNLQNIVLDEVEAAMYEGIMRYTRGNQSKAAKVLGVSRGTLRTKLMHYFGTTHVGGIYRV